MLSSCRDDDTVLHPILERRVVSLSELLFLEGIIWLAILEMRKISDPEIGEHHDRKDRSTSRLRATCTSY